MQAQPADLTAKARIRNAALELFAAQGAAGTPLRQVAEQAGVTVGLITHHFGSKDALRAAVDEHVVDRYRQAIATAPAAAPASAVVEERNRSVARMLRDDPAMQLYLRRAYLEPSGTEDGVLDRLTELTRAEITTLREAGVASTRRPIEQQVADVIVRQFGALLLQPLADRVWQRLGGTAPSPAVSTRLTPRES